MTNETDDIQTILKYQLLPWWERDGIDRLVVTEPTLRQFLAQSLPPMMQSTKRKLGKKVIPHGPRIYNNVATLSEKFPIDAQDTCRHPILYCVINGQADLRIADYVVHCPAGHFVLMRPGVPQPDGHRPHLEGGNSKGFCEILHVSLLPGASTISTWVCCSQGDRHWGVAGYELTQSSMVAQLNLFMQEMLGERPAYKKLAFNGLHNFFLLFLRELEAGQLQTIPRGEAVQSLGMNEDAMKFARQYMESHLHLHLTSVKVAEAVFMSRSNFLRHFSKATGVSFHQYLTKLRMQKAMELLSKSKVSVQIASQRVGVTPAQLYRIFKTYQGASPSEYRQKNKQ